MKSSLFNVFVELDGGRRAVYNTATARVVELEEPLWRLLKQKAGAKLPRAVVQPAELRASLAGNGMLVPDEIDETQRPRYQRLKTRFASPFASLVVLPTQECNLACHYCSARVTKTRGLPPMTLDVADRVVTFIGDLIEQSRCRLGTIGFYGGECLSNPEACSRIMVGLHQFGERSGVNIRFVVTTNGVLLTSVKDTPIIDLAETFHITLDGDRASHNRIRRAKDGDTYDRIMAGIALLMERGAGVIVRIHSNHLTGEGFLGVLDDLERAGLTPDGKAAVILGTYGDIRGMMNDPDSCNKVVLESRVGETEHRVALYQAGAGHRLAPLFRGVFVDIDKQVPKPLPLSTGCDYGKIASATINCVGEVFTCPDIPGMVRPIGRIDEQGRVRWEPDYYRQMARRRWLDGPCAACKYFPVCGGGCMFEPRQSFADCADLRRDFERRIIKFAEFELSKES